MNHLNIRSILVVVLGSVAALTAGASQDDKVVPVHQEPRHRLVFDSPGTRILDIQIPPGDTTLFHTHSDPILYVTLSTSRTNSQNMGGDWSGGAPSTVPSTVAGAPSVVPTTPPGRMFGVTSYFEKPHTHRVHNGGASLYRLLGVTNASAGDMSAAPSTDFLAKPELDNRWFRGYRWSLADAGAEHRHANPVVAVMVSGSGAAMIGGKQQSLATPGAFIFIEANSSHSLRGTAPETQVLEIEVRRPH